MGDSSQNGAPPPHPGFMPAGGGPPPGSPGQIPAGIVPGSTPDYKSLIANDPGLLMAEADLQASGVANIADRNAVFQRNVIDYGQLPDLTKAASALGLSPAALQGILGGQTGHLAQENTQAGTSILARLNSMNSKTIQQIKNALAARGMYRSGETGYQLGQQSQAYTNSQSDATKQLLDSLSSAQGQYVSAEQQRQIALAQAASDAANRAYMSNPSTPPSQGTASFAYTDANGNAVYSFGGSFYDVNGNPYSGPGPAKNPGPAPVTQLLQARENLGGMGY